LEEATGFVSSNSTELINAASDFVEGETDRKFQQITVTEKLRSYGTTRVIVSRAPLLSITSIKFDDGDVDLTNVTIDDADAGTIQKAGGWPWTAHVAPDISRSALPGTERKLTEVVYVGGFILPKDDAASAPDPTGPTLPADLERAVMQLVIQLNAVTKRDPTIKSEKLMSWSASYRDDVSSPLVERILQRYRRLC
jgi:hypothetical protein